MAKNRAGGAFKLSFLAALVALSAAFGCSPARMPEPAWQPETSLHEARARAEAMGQGLLIVYRAPWCASCAKLATSFADERVRRALQRSGVQVVAVEVDTQGVVMQDVPKAYGAAAQAVTAIPALRYFPPSNLLESRARRDGFMGAPSLAAWLLAAAAPELGWLGPPVPAPSRVRGG